MKKVLVFFSILLISLQIFAQCDGRYENEIFSNVTISTVTYSDSTGYEMDIYQPEGDVAELRPVIILAHGGSFVAGTNDNPTMISLCTTFAKRGYVAASIQYTLAPGIFTLLDTLQMLDIVVQGIADSKAAIRYFRKDAAGANELKIDPDQIWAGGNSAGAILMLHTAYINEADNLPGHILDAINLHGGFEGDRGNNGFSTHVNGVINLAGGLNRSEWLNNPEIRLVSCHGDQDGIVPFDCNDVYWGDAAFGALNLTHVCGSMILENVANDNGIINDLLVFEGDDHTPWEADATKKELMTDFISAFVFDHLDCNNSYTSQNDIFFNNKITIFPNPASNMVNISVEETSLLNIYNFNGELLLTSSINGTYKLNVKDYERGMYYLTVLNKNNKYSKSLIVN